jgi:site-specific recombinase XerD
MGSYPHNLNTTDPESIGFTVEEWYLSIRAAGRAAKTLQSYRWAMGHVLGIVGADTRLAEALTPASIERVLVTLDEQGLKSGSRALVYRSLRAFGSFCVRRDLLPKNPVKAVPSVKVKRTPKPVFEAEQMKAMLAGIEGNGADAVRDRALLSLLLTAGLRRSEAADLRVVDWDRARSVMAVRSGKTESSTRHVYLTVETEGLLARWLRARASYLRRCHIADQPNDEGPLFINLRRNSGTRITGEAIASVVIRRGQAAGLRLSPHSLRHQAVHTWHGAGMDLLNVATLLGHTSVALVESTYGVSGRQDRALAAARALDFARGGR